MKQLTCEMCGGTDMMKQDGVFVCQSCGIRYSVEEAKKMMVEGTVEVAGTVKIDSSGRLNNLYQIARRAKDDNNGENAAKYYDMILVEDPNSWEASFYLVYFRAMECKIAQIQSAGISISNCVDTVLKLIKEHVKSTPEQENAVNEVALRCTLISLMLYNGAIDHYHGLDVEIRGNYTQEMLNSCCAARNIMYVLGDNINSIFAGNVNLQKISVSVWKDGIIKHGGLMAYLAQKGANNDVITEYANKIKKYETSYQVPHFSTGGCYIATAVYGTYDCPQVWMLRRYRDFTLANSVLGRAFIRAYYAVSPTLVELFGKTVWFCRIWRGILDYKIEKLGKCGFEDTPYDGK